MSQVTAKAGVNSIVSRQAGVQSSVTSRGVVSSSEIEVANQPKISPTLGGAVGPQGERGPQGPPGSITGVNVDDGLILVSDNGTISGINTVVKTTSFETVSQSISNGANSVELTFANTYSSAPNVVASLHNSNQESFLNHYVSGVSTTKATIMLSAPTTSSNYTICGFITSV